jgi:hypothetical protein
VAIGAAGSDRGAAGSESSAGSQQGRRAAAVGRGQLPPDRPTAHDPAWRRRSHDAVDTNCSKQAGLLAYLAATTGCCRHDIFDASLGRALRFGIAIWDFFQSIAIFR